MTTEQLKNKDVDVKAKTKIPKLNKVIDDVFEETFKKIMELYDDPIEQGYYMHSLSCCLADSAIYTLSNAYGKKAYESAENFENFLNSIKNIRFKYLDKLIQRQRAIYSLINFEGKSYEDAFKEIMAGKGKMTIIVARDRTAPDAPDAPDTEKKEEDNSAG